MELQTQWLDRVIDLALAEDVGLGDVTTLVTVSPDAEGVARIWAKETLILAGMPVARRVFERVDASLVFVTTVEEGADVHQGCEIATVSGRLRSILIAERTALNFLQRLSGVSTLTRAFVREVEGTGVRIVDTRKTTPGLRMLQKYAVGVGGGRNHRWALDSGVLIKDNHLTAAGGVTRAVRLAQRDAPHTLRIEVECKTLGQVQESVDIGVDVILLDNMDRQTLEEAIRIIGGKTIVEVSGGITLETVRSYALPGVDLVSSGALTHSAPAVDIALDIVDATHFVKLGECDSTNAVAFGLAMDGAPDWTVVVADSQTAGRGRLGRKWHSLPGNLFVSVVLSPSTSAEMLQSLSLAVGFALFDTIVHYIGRDHVELKWPNDVLVDEKKVGGVLSQLLELPDGTHRVIVGVGVNRVGKPGDFPTDIQHRVVSLVEVIDRVPSRDTLLRDFLNVLRRHYRTWEQNGGLIDPDEFSLRAKLGRCVNISHSSGHFVTVAGVDNLGALLVMDQDGQVQTVQTGDVTPLEWES